MKFTTPLAAIAGAIVAGSAVFFYFDSQQGDKAPAPVALKLGEKVSGELSSKSLLNYSDGVRSALFNLNAEKDQIIRLTVTGALKPQISVLRDGILISRLNTGCGECEPERKANTKTILGFKTDATGVYNVAVSGVNASAYGPFQLEAETLKPYSGEPVKAGQSVTDWATNKKLEYRLIVENDGIYRIDMRASQPNLDPYLVLRDANGAELFSDDDSGGNLDALLQVALKAGNYVIVADSAQSTENFQGGFTLNVEQLELPTSNLLSPNAKLELDGAAATGIYSGDDLSYSFTLNEPALVTLDLNAQGFQPEVSLGSHDGMLRGNSSGERNRIRSALQAGTYYVNVSGGAQSGPFTVALATQPMPENAGGGTLKVGEPRQVVLLGGSNADIYTLNIDQPGVYAISMRAPDSDSYLTLQRDGETLFEDDDSGGNVDAQITTELRPGVYQVHASTLDGNSRDRRYTISVQRR